MHHVVSYWPIYVAGGLALLFVSLYLKRGSVKGVFIGGRIRHTIGHADGANALGFATLVTVHTLESKDPSRAVALEIVTKVAAQMRWTPVTVSKRDALKLAELLTEAANRSSN
jgi:hypothetical protein